MDGVTDKSSLANDRSGSSGEDSQEKRSQSSVIENSYILLINLQREGGEGEEGGGGEREEKGRREGGGEREEKGRREGGERGRRRGREKER